MVNKLLLKLRKSWTWIFNVNKKCVLKMKRNSTTTLQNKGVCGPWMSVCLGCVPNDVYSWHVIPTLEHCFSLSRSFCSLLILLLESVEDNDQKQNWKEKDFFSVCFLLVLNINRAKWNTSVLLMKADIPARMPMVPLMPSFQLWTAGSM